MTVQIDLMVDSGLCRLDQIVRARAWNWKLHWVLQHTSTININYFSIQQDRLLSCAHHLCWFDITLSLREMAPSLLQPDIPSIGVFSGFRKAQVLAKSICTPEDVSELELGQYWTDRTEAMGSPNFKKSTFLKAAWLLTLRCFQPEDLIHMSYDEGLDPESSTPMVFTVRVNPDWDVWSLLGNIEAQEPSALPTSSQSYTDQLSQLGPFLHICTSALRYLTVPEQSLKPSGLVDRDLEVSIHFHVA